MYDASLPQSERGSELLLEHCAVLTGPDESRPPALLRLEQELGGELARLLVGALAARRGRRLARFVAAA
jgi:hypothetical protein